jgi:hypothetical protein
MPLSQLSLDERRLLKNSVDNKAGAVAAVCDVCDRRNSAICREATLTERRYNDFFGNLPGQGPGLSELNEEEALRERPNCC